MIATIAVALAMFAAGLVVGLRYKHRRFLTERARRVALEHRFDAYRLADTRTDLDVIGPVTGQLFTVEQYDTAVADSEPLCAWGPSEECGGPVGRIDIPDADLYSIPSCDEHMWAARAGEVDATTAIIDDQTVVGDNYGVIAFPPHHLPAILDQAEAILRVEHRYYRLLDEGRTFREIIEADRAAGVPAH